MIGVMLAGCFCPIRLIGQLSGNHIAFGGFETADQLRQAPLVGVAGWTLTVGSNPIGVLGSQIFVNLLLQLTVGVNLVGHDNFLAEGLSKMRLF
jgi:hypothetical protein